MYAFYLSSRALQGDDSISTFMQNSFNFSTYPDPFFAFPVNFSASHKSLRVFHFFFRYRFSAEFLKSSLLQFIATRGTEKPQPRFGPKTSAVLGSRSFCANSQILVEDTSMFE